MCRVSVNFCHLAGGAAFDIFCNEGFHVWPPEVRCDELEGFGDSSMTCGHMIWKREITPLLSLLSATTTRAVP